MRRWVFKEREPGPSPEPSGADGLPRLIRRLLVNRGIDGAARMRRWLSPDVGDLHDPFLLPDLDRAASRIDRALRDGERILVFGDYDVDGITSAALLKRHLERIGGEVRVRIPARLTEGYGLSSVAIEEAAAWGAHLLITADCGTTALDEIAAARSRGIDVIVADHHVPGPELPEASAIVNPRREESQYPFPELAAVGVTAKILEGLSRIRLSADPESPSPNDLYDLVALGTIADAVSIAGENRIIVRHGLRIMRSKPKPAIVALAVAAGVNVARIGSADIAFQVVPRLNAAGRLGDSSTALDLLLSDDPERCGFLAAALETHNVRRRALLERVVQDVAATKGIAEAAARGEPIVLESSEWHPGVVGIAASRVAEAFGVPAILLAEEGGIARGSGRAAGEVDLLGLLRASASSLTTFGGHRAAVGLTLDVDRFPRFRDDLLSAARKNPVGMKVETDGIRIDAVARLSEIDLKLLDWLDRFEPFGPGNSEPVLAVQGRIVGEVRVLKERHLRFDIASQGVRRECIAFGRADRARDIEAACGEVHLAVVPSRNVYQGEERLQLQVKDIALVDPFGNG